METDHDTLDVEQMLADAAAASMAPLDLQEGEVADWFEALQVAGPWLTAREMALPVCSPMGKPLPGTLAGKVVAARPGVSDRVAVTMAATRLANYVHANERVGSMKVYTHRIARLAISQDADSPADVVFYLIEYPEGSVSRTGDVVGALVQLCPPFTYTWTTPDTGEIVTLADEGQYSPERHWRNGGIVSNLTAPELEKLTGEMTYEPDVRNAAWGLSTLRRLAAIAARRASRMDGAPEEIVRDNDPF